MRVTWSERGLAGTAKGFEEWVGRLLLEKSEVGGLIVEDIGGHAIDKVSGC